LCALPSAASGGGPLLVVVGVSSLALVLVPLLLLKPVLWVVTGRPVALSRLYVSYLIAVGIAGVAAPLAIAAITILPTIIAPNASEVFSIAGTWIYEGMGHPRGSLVTLIVWWIILSIAAVMIERRMLTRYGAVRSASIAALDGGVTFLLSAIVAAFLWRDLSHLLS
jgi:hypothetical protein